MVTDKQKRSVEKDLVTDRQKRFVEEYLIDLNATRAAIRAGYSPRSAEVLGSRLVRSPKVGAEIEAAQKARSQRTQVTADKVVRELAKVGFSDIRQVIRWGEAVAVKDQNGDERIVQGVHLLASDAVSADAAACIAEIRQTKEGLAVKLHPKLDALGKIGQHLGMFKDNLNLGLQDGVAALMERIAAQGRKVHDPG